MLFAKPESTALWLFMIIFPLSTAKKKKKKKKKKKLPRGQASFEISACNRVEVIQEEEPVLSSHNKKKRLVLEKKKLSTAWIEQGILNAHRGLLHHHHQKSSLLGVDWYNRVYTPPPPILPSLSTCQHGPVDRRKFARKSHYLHAPPRIDPNLELPATLHSTRTAHLRHLQRFKTATYRYLRKKDWLRATQTYV